MAKWYLMNNVRVGTHQRFAGELVDDQSTDTTTLKAVGGVLWTSTDAVIAAAAALAQKKRRNGAPLAEIESLMTAAGAGIEAGLVVANTTATNNATATGVTVASQTAVLQSSLAGASAPAKGATVHAGVAAGAPLNVVAAFTLPFPRRSLQVTLGAAGANPVNYTVTGTAIDGSPLVATCAAAGTGTYDLSATGAGYGAGADVFETITSWTSDVDPGDVSTLKTGDGIGLAPELMVAAQALGVDGVGEAAAATSIKTGGVLPTTRPNGVHSYALRYTAARAFPVTDPGHVHTQNAHAHALNK